MPLYGTLFSGKQVGIYRAWVEGFSSMFGMSIWIFFFLGRGRRGIDPRSR